MSALNGSSWCALAAANMGSGATLAVGLLGVDVREEVGEVTRVASLLGELATSSFKILLLPSLSSFTVVGGSSCFATGCDFSLSANVGDRTSVLMSTVVPPLHLKL